MRKRFDWAPRCGVLALLLILLLPPDAGAQSQPPPGQSAMQEKVAPVLAAATPLDSITVPDGTALTLQLVVALSSASAKVGDTVELTTPHPLRINGLIVVPKGTTLSGTVVQVGHPHRPAKNGQVRMAIEKLVLPSGEIVPLRPSKSASGKPGSMAARSEPGDLGPSLLLNPVAMLDPLYWIVVPILPFTKGHEAIYPAGTQTTVYFNGPVNLDRAALLKLQPPPYKGPAQVFFNELGAPQVFFTDISAPAIRTCGQVRAGDLSVPLRLELYPGTYSFSSGRRDERAAQLEVHEDHQYWIQGNQRGLFTRDPQQHQAEFETLEGASPVTNKDFTSLPPQDSCPQAAHP